MSASSAFDALMPARPPRDALMSARLGLDCPHPALDRRLKGAR